MDEFIEEYLSHSKSKSSAPEIYGLLPLSQLLEFSYPELQKKDPHLPKGWYELSHLSPRDRVDFTREFWLSKFPYCPQLDKQLDVFFSSLEDVSPYLIQASKHGKYESRLMYILKEKKGFFQGLIPADDAAITHLATIFKERFPPKDYVAFLRIHNGFCKVTDTGILPISCLNESFLSFRQFLSLKPPLVNAAGASINAEALIPFYESFGMPVFQCFWADWYPDQEMGNVYYSGIDHTVSDVLNIDAPTESLAFATFTDWLFFYLEIVG